MKQDLSFLTEELKEILNLIQSISNKKTINETSSLCVFTFEENESYVEASDQENTLKIYIDQTFIKFYAKSSIISFAVNSKKLFELIKEIKDKEIHIAKLEDTIKIVTTNSVTTLSTHKTSLIPSNELTEIENFTILDSQILKNSINFISPVFSSNTNNTINCQETALLEFDNEPNTISFSTTDGHCLAHITSTIKKTNPIKTTFKRKEFIISKKSISELKKIIDNLKKDSVITIGESQNSIIFSSEQFILKIRKTNIKFPNYKKIISGENHIIAECDLSLLIYAAKRAIIIADGQYHPAQLTIDIPKKTLALSIEKQSLGSIEDHLPLTESHTKHPKEEKITLNIFPAYILKALMALDNIQTNNKDLRILLTEAEKPIKLSPKIDIENTSFYIIMPMKQSQK
jgi:DNA polymerase III sliding clamp (beta) subunit (PCNA family)